VVVAEATELQVVKVDTQVKYVHQETKLLTVVMEALTTLAVQQHL
jgi:hypothetical protein